MDVKDVIRHDARKLALIHAFLWLRQILAKTNAEHTGTCYLSVLITRPLDMPLINQSRVSVSAASYSSETLLSIK